MLLQARRSLRTCRATLAESDFQAEAKNGKGGKGSVVASTGVGVQGLRWRQPAHLCYGSLSRKVTRCHPICHPDMQHAVRAPLGSP